MTDHKILIDFPGRIVMIGFGSIGQGVLPLILRHIGVPAERIVIVTAEDRGIEEAQRYGIKFIREPLTRENFRRVLEPLLGRGDFLLNLSVDVSSLALVKHCWERGAMYLDTCIEPWLGGYTDPGTAVNSGFLDGLPTAEAKQKITEWLEEKALGRGTINYKLRDWLFSRQRYWGEPFPIVWEGGHHRALAEAELPLMPPDLEDFKPTGTPEPPLSKATEWVRYSDQATRELNTMPQWAGSCWYYLRYCDARNDARFVGEEAERYWMGGGQPGGVDLYVGGTEHAVLHLLYARFWHKVLFDLGLTSTPEPFQRLVNQGLILGDDGQKMSKSRGNVVNPDDVVAGYGADSLRLYEMFMGPLEQSKPWSMNGVEGVFRFLARVWRVVMEETQEGTWILSTKLTQTEPDKTLTKLLHETIKKCGEDIEKLSFNTAISQMMVMTNGLTNAETRPVAVVATFLRVLSPFAPHLAEELNARLREAFPASAAAGFIADASWPSFDPAALVEEEIELVIQPLTDISDPWPVGWDLDKETRRGDLAPNLFKMVPVKFDNIPVQAVLDEIASVTGIPVVVNHYLAKQKEINLDEITLSYPSRKAAWISVINSAAARNRMKQELRLDEQSHPFVLIAPFIPRPRPE